MPRAFSETERSHIRDALLAAGLKRFSAKGIRATRIDDICRDAGIAKGSLYSFYASKEDLFMAIADEREAFHRNAMREAVAAARGTSDARLRALFDVIMERIETDSVLRIVRDRAELQHLIRKLPEERLAANLEGDQRFTREFARLLAERGLARDPDPRDLEALMTVMLALFLESDLISPASYAHAVGMLRDLFVVRLGGPR